MGRFLLVTLLSTLCSSMPLEPTGNAILSEDSSVDIITSNDTDVDLDLDGVHYHIVGSDARDGRVHVSAEAGEDGVEVSSYHQHNHLKIGDHLVVNGSEEGRDGKMFSGNSFQLGDIDISGTIQANKISIGSHVNIGHGVGHDEFMADDDDHIGQNFTFPDIKVGLKTTTPEKGAIKPEFKKLGLSEEEVRELREVFVSVDTNKDGRIVAKELYEASSNFHEPITLAVANEMVKTATENHGDHGHDHHEEDEKMPNGVGFEMFVHLVMYAPSFNSRDLVHYWVHAAGHHHHTHNFLTEGYKDADYRYERHLYNIFLSLDQTHDGVLDPTDLILAFHDMEISPTAERSDAEMMLFQGLKDVPYALTFDTWRNMIDKIRDQVAAADLSKHWRRVFKFYIEEGEMTGYHKRPVDYGVRKAVNNNNIKKKLGELKEVTECAPFKFLDVEEAMVEVAEGLNYKLKIKIETHRGYKCNEEIVEKVCENIIVFKPLPNVCKVSKDKGINCLKLQKPEDIKCQEVSAISGPKTTMPEKGSIKPEFKRLGLSEEEVKELTAVFVSVDTNGDGRIVAQELYESGRTLHEPITLTVAEKMVMAAREAHDDHGHDDDHDEDDHYGHHEKDEKIQSGVGFEMFVHLVMFAPTFNRRDLVHYWVHAAGHHYGHTHNFMTKGYKDADYRYERHFYNVFLSLDQTHDGVLDPTDLILAFHEMESSQLGNSPTDQSQAEMMLFKGLENVPYGLTFDIWRNMIDKIRDQVAAADLAKYWRRVFKFYIEEGEMTGYHKRHVDMGVTRLVSNHQMLKKLGEVKEITECAPFKFLGVEEAMVEVAEGLYYKLKIKIETHRGYKCNEEIVEKVCENVVVFKPLPNVCSKGIKCLQLKKLEDLKCQEVSSISGSLKNCIDECQDKSCQKDRDLKNGCSQMHTCAHGCQMRHLGLARSECMQKCNRNPASGCHPEVPEVVDYYKNQIPWKFDLCRDCQRSGCDNKFPVKEECEQGCQFYTNVPSVTNPESVKQVVDANELFACSLYNSLREKSEGENMLVSPYSASKVMAMVYMGARGETADQIKNGMNFPEKNVLGEGFKDLCRVLKGNDDFVLKTAEMLFMQEQDGLTLKDEFKNSIMENFYAEVTQIDFADDSAAARTEINNWVKTKTMEKIQDLIPQDFLNEFTKMVLVNAMYFKGDWVHQFAEKDTKKQSFYVNGPKSVVEVDMMHNDRSKFKMYECEELQAKTIELPYKGDRVSMYVVLPDYKNGLDKVEEKLCVSNGEKLKEICTYTDAAQEKKLSLHLPKFKVEKTIEMMDRLMELEMNHMFLPGKADFSGINGKKDLYVMEVIQKTFIDVNEYGSEAAAASGVGMGAKGTNLPEFKCDRPFLFFLYDKVTDMMLFKGRVVDPTL